MQREYQPTTIHLTSRLWQTTPRSAWRGVPILCSGRNKLALPNSTKTKKKHLSFIYFYYSNNEVKVKYIEILTCRRDINC